MMRQPSCNISRTPLTTVAMQVLEPGDNDQIESVLLVLTNMAPASSI